MSVTPDITEGSVRIPGIWATTCATLVPEVHATIVAYTVTQHFGGIYARSIAKSHVWDHALTATRVHVGIYGSCCH